MKTIFFPGSFNPFTKGHADILLRLLNMADRVIVGIGINLDKPDAARMAEENASQIRKFAEEHSLGDRVEVKIYGGLTATEAKRRGACCLARGVRTCQDFEYEYTLAAANRDAFGIDTILVPADPALSFVSSSLIREIEAHGESETAKKYLP